MGKIYLIGSLRNPEIPKVAELLRRETAHEIFDDWYAVGPEADDYWKAYEGGRGHSYRSALSGYAARHVFNFDKHHLDTSDAAILVYPAGKSAHLELGYMVGKGRPTIVFLDSQDRWDVMLQFAGAIVDSEEDLIDAARGLNI